MNLLIDKSFEKDTAKIDRKLKLAIVAVIEEVQNAKKLSDLTECKKLKGSKNAYRIRIGDYRLGFVFEQQTIIFVRFLPRDKIYDFFPK